MKRLFRKNQIMISALAIMLAVAGYLNFAGTKIGEEDFISVDGSVSEVAYDISDEDMYAISLREDTDGVISDYTMDEDIMSLDSDDAQITQNYLDESMEQADNVALNGEQAADEADKSLVDETVQLASNDQGESQMTDEGVPGEAVFTSASGVSSIAGAKLLKEQTRAQNKEALLQIINNEELTEEAKAEAVNTMVELTQAAQKESDAQMLLEAKGFAQSVVSISGESVDVMVCAESLTEDQTAQIMDIVQRKTEIAPENIIITIAQ